MSFMLKHTFQLFKSVMAENSMKLSLSKSKEMEEKEEIDINSDDNLFTLQEEESFPAKLSSIQLVDLDDQYEENFKKDCTCYDTAIDTHCDCNEGNDNYLVTNHCEENICASGRLKYTQYTSDIEGSKDISDAEQSSNCINYKYFSDALSQSQNLLNESNVWLSSVEYESKRVQVLQAIQEPCLEPMALCNINLQQGKIEDSVFHRKECKELMLPKLAVEQDLVLIDMEAVNHEYNINFDALPTEVKLRIFSYFSQRELCRYIAPVCSSWFQLSKDSSLWQSVTYSDFQDVRSDLLVKILVSWCKNIESLELNRFSDITTSEFKEIFQNCLSIKHISLAFCSQVNEEILSSRHMNCKQISSVNMEGCHNVSDQSFYNFIGLPLRRVNVSHCNQISDDGGIFLARNFKNLLEINFDGIQWITEDFVQKLVENHHETLEKVFLDGENLTDNAVQLLSRCINLRYI